jgi:beta-N-acetylhexosaminidase
VIDLLGRDANLVTLFAPEHGLWGEAQAGVHIGSGTDPRTELPVHSLYGERRAPTAEMLSGLDVLVFCMQDAGCRYYTFKTTMARCMKAAAEAGIAMVVLDRPTPLRGDRVHGNIGQRFFPLPLPTRYGMTLGELALWLNGESDPKADLTVVPVIGWSRHQWYDQTGLSWVAPSPNLPTLDAALAFTCTGVLEGTNMSEGRGTTRPFELSGAPWVDGFALADALAQQGLPGAVFRPAFFEPTFSKWESQICCGVQLHIVDRDLFDPARTCLHLLSQLRQLHPEQFEINGAALDVRFGASWVREALEAGQPADEIAERCREESAAFEQARRPHLLY